MARDFFNGSNPTAIEMLSYIDENFSNALTQSANS